VPIAIHWKKKPVDRTRLARLIRAVLSGEGREGARVGIVLTDDAVLRRLNADFRGKDRVTDVLSFPADADDSEDGRYLGDIAVSLERAAEQAPRFGNRFPAEVDRLVVHGLLHLCGHDHHAPADGRRMKARERFYLEAPRPAAPRPVSRTRRATAR
jgi:probable rRNA maturation factor